MLSEEKTIEIVNKYLQRAHEANIRRSFPVVASKIWEMCIPVPAQMKIMKKTHAAQKYKRQLVFLLFVTGKHRYSTKHVTASIGATGAVVSAAATVETVGTYAVAS